MRYACVKEMDVTNGNGIGISLFTQGCKHHCKGCFNPETWDFNGGKEWNKEIEDKLLRLVSLPYISRFSILGGEPMEYADEICDLTMKVKEKNPNIKVWLWSGYTLEEILNDDSMNKLYSNLDYLIDGKFIEEQKDLTLDFRGSSNQRIIKIKE